MKLCTVIGARPQFIKAATISRLIKESNDIDEIIVHTGQHYDTNMSKTFFQELNIPEPAYHLNIGSHSHGKQTGLMLSAIEEILLQEKPDWLLVYGDTNSTLSGALAAAKLNIPVAHIEAGLRSFNQKMPEEINRVMTDHLSDLLFTPSTTSSNQLIKEGISQSKIHLVGDVMYDAILYYNHCNDHRKTIVEKLDLSSKSFALATIHRAENTDNHVRLTHISQALIELSYQIPIVLPLHPRTKSSLINFGLLEQLENNLILIEPVGYLDMLALEKDARYILTDSGGVQKEAYFNQVPCLTLRDETEWVELVELGWNQLISPQNPFSLIEAIAKPINNTQTQYPYGKGDAAHKIIESLTNLT